jgi:hypothetical protein
MIKNKSPPHNIESLIEFKTLPNNAITDFFKYYKSKTGTGRGL